MKRMKRWLGIILSVVLVVGTLQVPVYAAETGETTVEATVEKESIESEEGLAGEEPEEESAGESSGDLDPADEAVMEEAEQDDDSEDVADESISEENAAEATEEAPNVGHLTPEIK